MSIMTKRFLLPELAIFSMALCPACACKADNSTGKGGASARPESSAAAVPILSPARAIPPLPSRSSVPDRTEPASAADVRPVAPPTVAVDEVLDAYEPHKGRFGEWIRTFWLDVKINIVKEDKLELPQVDFENRFDTGIDITPCVFRIEYESGAKVEGTESCAGQHLRIGRRGAATFRPKDGPLNGELKRVDLVYGRRGEIPEKNWVRFVATR